MCGYGTLCYPLGGLAYIGYWRDDKFNGKGTMYNECPTFSEKIDIVNFDDLGESWIKYDGYFVDDVINIYIYFIE